MIFAEILWALAFAVLIGLLVSAVFRRPGPWGGMLWFFLILFLGTWALGAWARPIGPVWVGQVAWVPFLLAALFVALFVLAATPEPEYRRRMPDVPEEAATKPATRAIAGITIFFWLLVVTSMIIILARYILFPPLAV